jgi:hypothetical protein
LGQPFLSRYSFSPEGEKILVLWDLAWQAPKSQDFCHRFEWINADGKEEMQNYDGRADGRLNHNIKT